MKVLLDTCVWGKAIAALQAEGHDVVWSGDWEADPGDDQILQIAHSEGRVVVTLDKDFGQLAVALDRPHSGIIRLVGIPALEQAPTCVIILERYREDLTAGAIVTVEPGRVRVRAGSQ